MHEDEVPEIWTISGVRPLSSLDDAGNAGLLARGVLTRVLADGLLVKDVLNPDHEGLFRHTRRSIRDALVLAEMYASISLAIVDERPPLAELIQAYGLVNDKLDAYQAKAAVEASSRVKDREKEVEDAFATPGTLPKTSSSTAQSRPTSML